MSWSTEAQLFANVRNVVREGETWRQIGWLLRPFTGRLVLLTTVCLVGALPALVQPFLFRDAIDAIATGPAYHGPGLATVALLLLATGAVAVAAGFEQTRRQAVLVEELADDLRARTFAHVQDLPYGFFVHANPGGVFNRLWDEVMRAAWAVAFIVAEGAGALLTVVIGLALIVAYDWRLAAVPLFFVLVLIPTRWARSRMRGHFIRQVVIQTRYTGFLQERTSLAGVLLTKVFALGEQNRAVLHGISRPYQEAGVAAHTWRAVTQALVAFALAVAVAGTVWVGGLAVVSGSMSIGTLALLLFYLRLLMTPIQRYGELRFELTRGVVAFGRILELLNLPTGEARTGSAVRGPLPRRPRPGLVEFVQVGFRYPRAEDLVPESLASAHLGADADPGESAPVLHDVTFRVEPGQFVALVGSSGSGKSSIAALAAGLFAPSSGEVRVGGREVVGLTDTELAESVSLVSQDTHLLHDTVRENLLIARPDATDRQIVRACAAAGLHPFIRSLANGYGTVVGERGARLSGGQRQRLAFARAVLRDPTVVVLDEATAHLDTESEVLLREAVDRVLAGRSRLVIAHRLSTIVDADLILVLEGGRIVERGTHDELMGAAGRYRTLHQAQAHDGGATNERQETTGGPRRTDQRVPGPRAGAGLGAAR